MSHRLKLTLIGPLTLGLISGLALIIAEFGFHRQREVVEQHASYVLYTREEMIDSADVIVVGKVISISPTRWNQDSGEQWDSIEEEPLIFDPNNPPPTALQLHTVELEVVQPIADTVGLDKQITITVLGKSPLDGHADHSLKVGDQAIIFAVQTDLVWRNEKGTKQIFELVGVPSDAHFIVGDDGLYHGRPDENPFLLAEVINRVAQRRPILVEP